MTADATPAPVNLERALARVMGNQEMLDRILARFRDAYRGAAVAIGAALRNGEVDEARRLAHSLKGASGMIEAGALHGHARALEAVLRDGGDGSAQLAQLEAELERVMRSLDAALGDAPAVSG